MHNPAGQAMQNRTARDRLTRMPSERRPGRRQAGTRTQHAKILDSAQRLILEHGAQQVSTSEIAAAAQTTEAAVSAAFESHEQLVLAVFERLSRDALTSMYAACGVEDSWVEKVRGALEVMLAYLDDHPDRARFLILDTLTGDPELLTARNRVLEQIAQALDRDAPEPDAEISSSQFGPQAIVSGVVSVLHARLIDRVSPALSELYPPLMGVLVLPYLNPEQTKAEIRRGQAGPRPTS